MISSTLQASNFITNIIMGNDGGTIATQRSYVRGAKLNYKDAEKKASVDTGEGRQEVLNTCAISGVKLKHDGSEDIVACPFGKLYLKEAVVRALLRRAQAESYVDQQVVSPHIRGLKDLYTVRFATDCQCPIIGQDLSTGTLPCFVIASKDSKSSFNVISEKAIKQMGISALQEDYGPFKEIDMVRLAPTTDQFKVIQDALYTKRVEEKKRKAEKRQKRKTSGKDDKEESTRKNQKRKTKGDAKLNGKKVAPIKNTAVSIAKATVANAVANDSVLSSIFVKNDSSSNDKEKRDKLFITNGR